MGIVLKIVAAIQIVILGIFLREWFKPKHGKSDSDALILILTMIFMLGDLLVIIW